MFKRNITLAIKAIIFVGITLFVVAKVNTWMTPKYYYNDNSSATNTYGDFYNLEKDTVDVLFLGSSHAMYSFNPQVFYDNFRITSYNLGSDEQSVLMSYYWLKEALKYQSPKVVVLETFTFHDLHGNFTPNGLNCDEPSIRKAMDPMKISTLKVEAAKAIEQKDSAQSWTSFFLLNQRYHSRWESLSIEDFNEKEMLAHGGVKGFIVSGETSPGAHDEVFYIEDYGDAVPEPMSDVALEYLPKIIDLCNENGIQLIFVNIPMSETVERYKSTREFAKANNIPFYDLNEASMYRSIDYSAERDKTSHPNYRGAEKISLWLGKILLSEYNITGRKDSSFAKSRQVYEHKVKNILLTETQNIYGYLDSIDDPNYSIFIFAPISYSEYYDEDMRKKFRKLGFPIDLSDSPVGVHYCALKDGDGIIEHYTADNMSFEGLIGDSVPYNIKIDTSVGDINSHTYSMLIDGVQCGNSKAGINIVVYDNDAKTIVDKINVDTTKEDRPLSHY